MPGSSILRLAHAMGAAFLALAAFRSSCDGWSVPKAMLAGLALVVINLPLGFVAKLFNACQQTAESNLWGIAANITGFLGLLLGFAFGSH